MTTTTEKLKIPDISGAAVFQKCIDEKLIEVGKLVVVVSAEARAKRIDELYSKGIHDFILKPIKATAFRNTLSRYLDKLGKNT